MPMTRLGWLVRAGCAAGAAWNIAAGAQSLFDGGGVGFTVPQAARGRVAYMESCAACHGPHLDDGQFAAPLKGAAFKTHWHDQSPQALLSLVMQRMPPASPGSLGNQTYADIEAYLLQENGDRAGTTELAASSASMGGGASPESLVAPGNDSSSRAVSENDSSPRVGAALLDNQDADYRAAMAARQSLLGKLTPVSDAMLRDPGAADWLMWRGTYATLGYSPLDQINTRTVRHLGVAWTLTLPPSANEVAPLIHDGVLFIEGGDTVEAIDAAEGGILWQYVRALPDALHHGRDARMRGMAIYEDMLFAPTADGHIVALDVRTGHVRWDHAVVTPEQ
jgi:alcohol dehydrogenase (cytochrome c)